MRIYNAFTVPSADYSSIARAVARSAAKRPEIQAAYVFGSVATGRVRADSDVDVAVLIDRSIRRSRTLSYRLKLMADLGSALHRSDVEVVILNDAPPLLAHRVLSRGVLAFERSRSARVRFQVKTAGQYPRPDSDVRDADSIPEKEREQRPNRWLIATSFSRGWRRSANTWRCCEEFIGWPTNPDLSRTRSFTATPSGTPIGHPGGPRHQQPHRRGPEPESPRQQ